MKRWGQLSSWQAILAMVVIAIIASTAWVRLSASSLAHSTTSNQIDDSLRELLSGIDFVPARSMFDDLLGTQAASTLIDIARNSSASNEIGLRLRAYQALGLYPQEALAPLLDAVDQHGSNLIREGPELLLAKTSMEALAEVARSITPSNQTRAIAKLANVLNHPSLDVRASAAYALGHTGLLAARFALEQRRAVETAEQVLIAIDRSLSTLGEN